MIFPWVVSTTLDFSESCGDLGIDSLIAYYFADRIAGDFSLVVGEDTIVLKRKVEIDHEN